MRLVSTMTYQLAAAESSHWNQWRIYRHRHPASIRSASRLRLSRAQCNAVDPPLSRMLYCAPWYRNSLQGSIFPANAASMRLWKNTSNIHLHLCHNSTLLSKSVQIWFNQSIYLWHFSDSTFNIHTRTMCSHFFGASHGQRNKLNSALHDSFVMFPLKSIRKHLHYTTNTVKLQMHDTVKRQLLGKYHKTHLTRFFQHRFGGRLQLHDQRVFQSFLK